MTNELFEWFLILIMISSSIGFGLAVGFGLGRRSMLDQILGRPICRTKRPTRLSIRRRGNVQQLEVLQ